MRAVYAQTLAASTAFGYVLGIGDRHLDNLLLDTRAGAVLHIDFGTVFGIGATLLPVAELIPCRLSPQLLGALRPLDGLGLLRHYLGRAFTALRDEGTVEVLQNAMDMYVHDPVVDWLKHPAVDHAELEKARAGGDFEPRRRVAAAVRKLRGTSPAALLLEDLGKNSAAKANQTLGTITKIVRRAVPSRAHSQAWGTAGAATAAAAAAVGARGGGEKGREGPGPGSGPGGDAGAVMPVKDQVDELLALATAPDIVVRNFAGLAAWV